MVEIRLCLCFYFTEYFDNLDTWGLTTQSDHNLEHVKKCAHTLGQNWGWQQSIHTPHNRYHVPVVLNNAPLFP